MNKDNQEIEIKIKLEDSEALFKKALELGGEELKDKEGLEHDVMYDDGKGFYDFPKVLRLRTAPFGNLLTYKEKNPKSDHKNFLIRTEIETFINDPKAMDEILQKLGFFPYRIKEKYVKKIKLGDFVLEFHKMAFLGDFLEIEGEEIHVDAMLGKLRLSVGLGINRDYSALFYEYCDQNGLSRETPMTFEEEKTHHLQK
jgi:predicted adenylyl cyclase CyaB